jgi:hypothetical protein
VRKGYLSEYFDGVAIKRLAAVEVDTTRSNQHEFNATREMLDFMGRPSGRERLPTKFIYLCDEDGDPLVDDASLTLYDSRENQPHRHPEYRFYFTDNEVVKRASEGDLLVIAKRRDAGMLVVVAENGSSAASQMEWLFGFSQDTYPRFSVRAELENDQDRVGFAATFILESIGVVVEKTQDSFLDTMLAKFGGSFPSTREFSAFARSTLQDVSAEDNVDAAVMAWMEREEILFRTLERHQLGDRLRDGFDSEDVDGFLGYALSVLNRRKSRVGLALENHIEHALVALRIRFERTPVTENNSKPDFLFPGAPEYHTAAFPAAHLTMLGVKSTCKDRWRQVLAEADRIDGKHLLTLEASISTSQTDEMQAKSLQLVVPRAIHASYKPAQQEWLFDVHDFIELVQSREAGAPATTLI